MSEIIRHYTEEFRRGSSLLASDAEALLDSMVASADEPLLTALFISWDQKGIREDEIFSLATIMRSRSVKVHSKHTNAVDIVGTGGSKAKTFNVSTAAAFVAAGGGVPIAKHGNRAATSNSGSSDVLDELGIGISTPEMAERSLNGADICFMFAPNHHLLSSTLAKVRRELGFPTIFNCIGPLCNPAQASRQLIGVWDEAMLPIMANLLLRLGTERSWIVHGTDGLDEISISSSTNVAEVTAESVSFFDISPRDFSLPESSIEEFRTTSAAQSSSVIKNILANELQNSPAEHLVLINSMAAFYLAGHAGEFSDALSCALQSIRTGSALRKMIELREFAST